MFGNTFDPFGTILKQFRKRQRLTQQQLAQALGVHRNTIGRWEEGSFLPESKALTLDLARHLHLDASEARQLLDASLSAPTPLWSVPYPRNPFFTGRDDILATLHTCLSPGQQPVALTQSYALHGLGGIGKTQLALEYAYRHVLAYRAIFWIGAETVEQISSSLLRIAERLDLPECNGADQQRVVAAVQRWLETHGEWLLIWDNLEDLDLLRRYLPASKQGALLLTTRQQALGTFAEPLALPPLREEEGVALLFRRSRHMQRSVSEAASQQQMPQGAFALADAAELVHLLGGLPLALDQAGAYLEETGCSLKDYLQRYRQYRPQVLARRGVDGGVHPASVATTLQLAVERIEQRSPAAVDLLRFCAFLYPDAIPEELFTAGASHLGTVLGPIAADPYQFDLALATLRNASFIVRHPKTRVLSIHRLVQAVLQDQMTSAEMSLWSERLVRVIHAAFPQPVFATWDQCERCLAQALACVPLLETMGVDLPEGGELFFKVGSYLLARGRYREAEPLLEQARTLGEQEQGLDHLDLIPRLMSLAELFWQEGRYEHAEVLMHRVLAIQEHYLELDHPNIAETLNNLALLSWQRGDYRQAEPLYQRALQIREQQLGPEHLETAETLHNLALLYWKQRRYDQAEPLYLRALQMNEQQLGLDHLEVAETLNNLAALYWSQKRYEQAEALHQRVLQMREQQLGSEHPATLITLHNLAHVYRDQGKYEQAELLYQRVLQARKQLLGPEHPDLARTLVGLATLYSNQENYEQAESVYQQALHIQEQRLGFEHLDMADTLLGLASLYQKQGRNEQTRLFYQQALSIQERQLGTAHPDTLATRSSLLQIQNPASFETNESLAQTGNMKGTHETAYRSEGS